jgi:hypothetical protein
LGTFFTFYLIGYADGFTLLVAIFACAAATIATGTLNGLQETVSKFCAWKNWIDL